MLCVVCNNALLPLANFQAGECGTEWGQTTDVRTHHETFAAFCKAVKIGCYICTRFKEQKLGAVFDQIIMSSAGDCRSHRCDPEDCGQEFREAFETGNANILRATAIKLGKERISPSKARVIPPWGAIAFLPNVKDIATRSPFTFYRRILCSDGSKRIATLDIFLNHDAMRFIQYNSIGRFLC
jgi:hypothetical protein